MVGVRVVFFPLVLAPLPLFLVLPVLGPQGTVFVVIDDWFIWSRATVTELVRGLHLLSRDRSSLGYVVLAYWLLWLYMYRSPKFNHCLRDL